MKNDREYILIIQHHNECDAEQMKIQCVYKSILEKNEVSSRKIESRSEPYMSTESEEWRFDEEIIHYFLKLCNNFGNYSRTNCSSSFTDRKSKSLFHRNWCSKFDSHLDVITRHNHLYSCRKLNCSSYISSSEVELWFISLEEWSMSSTLILRKYVYLGSKFCMWFNRTWLC